MADQGQREPTRDGGTRQRWTRCGLVSPEGSNRRSSRPSSSDDLPPKRTTPRSYRRASRAPRGHEKAMATCRQRPGPKQIQAESPDRA